MSPWAVVFLGIIALATLAQTGILLILAFQGRRLSTRVEELRSRVEQDLKPSLDSLGRITRNLAEISDIGVLQARRIDVTLADTLDKVEATTQAFQKFVVRPLGPISEVSAFFKGVRRGVEVYGRLRGFEKRSKAASRSYTEDEHLFI